MIELKSKDSPVRIIGGCWHRCFKFDSWEHWPPVAQVVNTHHTSITRNRKDKRTCLGPT